MPACAWFSCARLRAGRQAALLNPESTRQACRNARLPVSGKKEELARRLQVDCQEDRQAVLARRQTYQASPHRKVERSRSPKPGARRARDRTSKSKQVRSRGTCLSIEDFQKLWWAVKARAYEKVKFA